MSNLMRKLYWYFAEKNAGIRREYEPYMSSRPDKYANKAWKRFGLLLRLNWHYRIRKKKNTLVWHQSVTPAVKPGPRRAYLGAESARIKHIPPIHFAKRLLQYDVVSFDIFDTLIFRPFVKPADLFMMLGEHFNFFCFTDLRVAAEKRAREIAFAKTGSREITIHDIYAQLERETGIPAEEGIKAELALEKDFCFANPYMKQVFDILLAQGKRIVITSDMYWPESLLRELLEKCGYSGYERLFVSCDYKTGKGGRGDLFKIVKHALGYDKSYCHIGDNIDADIKSARQNGFTAFHYPNVNHEGDPYRATMAGMSELIGSAYGGIVNAKLYSGEAKYSEAYEMGYTFGGLYVLGYCSWIHDYAKRNSIDKILFLARDGAVYSQVFNRFFGDVANEYVYWSRFPSIKAVADRNRYDFLLRFVRHRLNDVRPMSLKTVLNIMGLDFLQEELPKYGLEKDVCLVRETVPAMESLIIDNWSRVLEAYETENKVIENYLKKVIGNAKSVAIVDVGWLGSGPAAIKYLVEEKWKMDCKVSCLVAAGYSTPPHAQLPMLANGTVESYMFSRFYNRNLADHHMKTNNHCNNLFFELFTQATSPTIETFAEKDGMLSLGFGFVETENYQLVRELHQGIVDFATDYYKHFSNYSFMFNISGYDAYIPFRHLTHNPALVKKVFGDFVITRNLGYDTESFHMEKLGDTLKKRGL